MCFYLISQRYQYLLQFGSVPSRKKVQARSYLDRVDINKLETQLKVIMEQEKLFCDERLTLPRLSEALGITTHQLSEYLNEYHRKNFNNFVNSFRINEAKKILVNDLNKNIHDIAYSVGFNSYSAFHSSFKKETGNSPADYRQKIHPNINIKGNN
jgi:YesN/AraC family two-component response regulator